jgi:hypothetical protein
MTFVFVLFFMIAATSYTPFFRECWDRKSDTLLSFNAICPRVEVPKFSTFKPHQNSDRYKTRPAATLPRQSAISPEADPLYDVPHGRAMIVVSEESDDERMSSSPHGIIEEVEEEVYSSIPDHGDVYYEDTDQLIQPSSKRSLYAGTEPSLLSPLSSLMLSPSTATTRGAEKNRRSFPATSFDGTDRPHEVYVPYQTFRKSNSMKLEAGRPGCIHFSDGMQLLLFQFSFSLCHTLRSCLTSPHFTLFLAQNFFTIDL